MISNCCGAEGDTDMGICPKCKEHCSWLEECPNCDGDDIDCELCNGEGYVPVPE